MSGPSCLCGHFDDCPACHEPGYDRHQVLKILAEMSAPARSAFLPELAAALRNGGTLTSNLERISGVEKIELSFEVVPCP